MKEEEIKRSIRSCGWTPLVRCRHAAGHRYIYAARKVNGKRYERYICRLDDAHAEEIIKKKLSL